MRPASRQRRRKNKGIMGVPVGERAYWKVMRPFHRNQKQRGCQGCGLEPGLELGGACLVTGYASLVIDEAFTHRDTEQKRGS